MIFNNYDNYNIAEQLSVSNRISVVDSSVGSIFRGDHHYLSMSEYILEFKNI